MSTGAVQNTAGICVMRGLLGIFEASFGAGAPYYLSLFYQRKELALRVSLLLGMSPLANCFAGALAYGMTYINHGIEPWWWLFIIGM
jgi:MFS family permease